MSIAAGARLPNADYISHDGAGNEINYGAAGYRHRLRRGRVHGVGHYLFQRQARHRVAGRAATVQVTQGSFTAIANL